MLHIYLKLMKTKKNAPRMRKVVILLLGMAILSMNSCRKEKVQSSITDDEVKALQKWYNSIERAKNNFSSLTPKWDKVIKSENDKDVVYEVELNNPEGIFTSYEWINPKNPDGNSLNTIRLLLLENKRNGVIKGGYLSIAPKNKSVNPRDIHLLSLDKFSGKISFYNIKSKFLKGLIYESGIVQSVLSSINGEIDRNKLSNLYQRSRSNNTIMSVPNTMMSNQSCNYDLEPVYGEACVEAGDSGIVTCKPYVRYYEVVNKCTGGVMSDMPNMDDQGGGGGASSGETIPSDIIPADPYMPGQDKSPIDPKKFVDCFDDIPDAGASYKVAVQVQEPIPGTRLNYGINGFGHTAITVTKNGANGASVTQTVGFYPAGGNLQKIEGPSKMVDNAKIGDTEKVEFTISMEFDLGNNTNSFNKILGHIASPPAKYELYGMNCTTFVVEACANGGITLPSALNGVIGFYDPTELFQVNTPAGLGASMRDAKANGDKRVKTNKSTAPTSKGACN